MLVVAIGASLAGNLVATSCLQRAAVVGAHLHLRAAVTGVKEGLSNICAPAHHRNTGLSGARANLRRITELSRQSGAETEIARVKGIPHRHSQVRGAIHVDKHGKTIFFAFTFLLQNGS